MNRRDLGSQVVPGWASQPTRESEAPMTTAADHRAEWWSLAACQHADPDLFFPVSGRGAARAQIGDAKAVCARCPVRSDCLHYALAAGPVQGVWGGTSEEERRLLRQRQAKARVRAARQPGATTPARRPGATTPARRPGATTPARRSGVTIPRARARAAAVNV
jgi:WhiB family transcriptional regulator, redox-sensing transcriptional regulator